VLNLKCAIVADAMEKALADLRHSLASPDPATRSAVGQHLARLEEELTALREGIPRTSKLAWVKDISQVLSGFAAF
jgi:hypothetical protein